MVDPESQSSQQSTEQQSSKSEEVLSPPKVKKIGFLGGFRNNFLAGIVVAAPIGITFALVYWLVTGPMAKLDGFVQNVVPKDMLPGADFNLYIPGLGVLIAVAGLVLLGAMAKNFVGRSLIRTGDRILDSMPIVRNLYGFFKNVFEMALQQSERSFEEVALVEYPSKGTWAVCFVVTSTKGELKYRLSDVGEDMVSVFLPTTPNPTSGFLLFVPRKKLRVLDMTVEEGAKLIFSAGLVTPVFEAAENEKAASKFIQNAASAVNAKTGILPNIGRNLGRKKDSSGE